MGSLNINCKRRRKFFDIIKYDEESEEEKVHSALSDTSSNELMNDIEELIDKEMVEHSEQLSNSEFPCPVCLKGYNSKRDVKSHMKVHTQNRPYHCSNTACEKTFKSTSNMRRHEKVCRKLAEDQSQNEFLCPGKHANDITKDDDHAEILWDSNLFDEILSEETNLANEEQGLSEPLLDDYNDMLENLIASASPDELVLKNSISNEIPDDFDTVLFESCKRKLCQTDFELDFDEESVKQIKKGEADKHVPDVTNDNILDHNVSLDTTEQEISVENTHLEKNITFENLANEKIFQVLNPNVRSFKEYDYTTENLTFSVKIPDFQSISKSDNKKVLKAGSQEIFGKSQLEISNRLGIGTAKNDAEKFKSIKKKRAPYKRSKRGSLGWQFKLEMEQFDENGDDTGCERLKNLDDGSNSYIKDHVDRKAKSYNKTVLENIYSNASKTKNFLQLFKQREHNRHGISKLNAIEESETDKTKVIRERKSTEPSNPESSQQDSPPEIVIYHMPCLDLL